MMINAKPTSFPIVNVSPKKRTPMIKTNAGAKLINGYAVVISNLVIAIIQNNDAINAATNPENI